MAIRVWKNNQGFEHSQKNQSGFQSGFRSRTLISAIRVCRDITNFPIELSFFFTLTFKVLRQRANSER